MTKVKISFVLPQRMQQEVKETMIKEGYDLKGKSRWISEAISNLLALTTYVDLVKISDEMSKFEKLESVIIERDLKQKLDDAVIEVRKIYPSIEGVQSRILRAAIMQRLLFA